MITLLKIILHSILLARVPDLAYYLFVLLKMCYYLSYAMKMSNIFMTNHSKLRLPYQTSSSQELVAYTPFFNIFVWKFEFNITSKYWYYLANMH